MTGEDDPSRPLDRAIEEVGSEAILARLSKELGTSIHLGDGTVYEDGDQHVTGSMNDEAAPSPMIDGTGEMPLVEVLDSGDYPIETVMDAAARMLTDARDYAPRAFFCAVRRRDGLVASIACDPDLDPSLREEALDALLGKHLFERATSSEIAPPIAAERALQHGPNPNGDSGS